MMACHRSPESPLFVSEIFPVKCRSNLWLIPLVGFAVFFQSTASSSGQEILGEPRAERAIAVEIDEAAADVAAEKKPAAAETPADKPENKEEPEIDIPRAPVKEVPPRQVRLHLLDGSILTGDLSVEEITVETTFGKLVVPINKIRSFTPGLDSYPEQIKKIETLVEQLGGDDYQSREAAHKELSAMGIGVQNEIVRFVASDNAEIKRHIGEILKEIEEQAEESEDLDEGGEGAAQPWIRLDTVVTTDFTVTGKVSPQNFELASKYGPLKVSLADVKRGERDSGLKESFRRSLSVPGENLAQRTFKSTGIRVQAGDKISIKADGTIVMSPWGTNSMSTPDGGPNYGWYIPNQIPGGCLVAKIGDKGTVFKVGRSLNFTAKSSGLLQLAVGMQGDYAGEGYQFPGEYRVKLRVDPK
ncbi:hypothetical protein Psta_2577 [Pirellula staleyi DSM 6068]|uniref:Uncharacterized protein n=1 Tax=Pirellula staleyi (strain ATCC 27377 / DSM 6068 / ICPB 4128) TaxID=530564 RepID=D2R5R4_PIRSD|nr:hypothetical protein Psta_2577 [Pirellula staleyi DSM 6068]